MIKKLIYICAVMVGSLSGLSSCSLDIPPSDQYSDPDAIVDISTARSLLSSVYSLYPHYEYELSILGDDFCPTSIVGKDMSLKNLYAWQDNSITTLAESLWGEYYNTIASCNALLERVDNITLENASEEKDKAAIISEAKALKALCYFNLLRLFAPAYDKNPQADGIVLKDELGLAFPKRSSIETCTTTIRTLLTEAAAVENNPDKNGWLSQTAVYYLLAGLAVACRHGFEIENALDIAEKTYVNVNIHQKENEDKLKSLAQLPDSCEASADCLQQQRAIFEQYNVFSPAMIDGIIRRLRGYEDKTLRADLEGKPMEMLDLVHKYFHCG